MNYSTNADYNVVKYKGKPVIKAADQLGSYIIKNIMKYLNNATKVETSNPTSNIELDNNHYVIIPLTYDYHIPLLKNTEYLTYLPKNFLLYPFQDSIKGVFVGNHTQGINGSLWSLPYEFTMYIIISLLIIFSKKNRLFIISFLFICFLLLANFKQNFLHSLFSSLLLMEEL